VRDLDWPDAPLEIETDCPKSLTVAAVPPVTMCFDGRMWL